MWLSCISNGMSSEVLFLEVFLHWCRRSSLQKLRCKWRVADTSKLLCGPFASTYYRVCKTRPKCNLASKVSDSLIFVTLAFVITHVVHICYINLCYHACSTKISTLFHCKSYVGIKTHTIFIKPYIVFQFQVLWVCITSAWKVGRVLRVAASSWTLWRYDTMLFRGCNGWGMELLHILLKYWSKLLSIALL